jgi:hypothetical protein
MKTTDFIKESVQIADDAHAMHRDHEVQMAREECYHIAQNAIELHKLLKSVAETTGIDGWASEKISIANDLMSGQQQPQLGEDASAGATGAASIGGAAMPLLFGKKKIVKRKKS